MSVTRAPPFRRRSAYAGQAKPGGTNPFRRTRKTLHTGIRTASCLQIGPMCLMTMIAFNPYEWRRRVHICRYLLFVGINHRFPSLQRWLLCAGFMPNAWEWRHYYGISMCTTRQEAVPASLQWRRDLNVQLGDTPQKIICSSSFNSCNPLATAVAITFICPW